MKKVNFYSGPAILPQPVLEQAKAAIDNFAGTGLSILEISHRSKEFVKVMEEARALVKELMQLSSDYEVIFLQGGAASQFYMVPLNLLNDNETAAYFDTGRWAHLAMQDAKNFGNVHIACSSEKDNYRYIPKEYSLSSPSGAGGPKYVHITTNNTVYGTQFSKELLAKLKTENVPVVADMSSDIFSRQLDFNQFDMIYAGAQKNAGAAGTTIVAVNKNILGKVSRKIPKMLDYRQHIEKESMVNTPSVFAVYVSYLTLLWIKKEGLKSLEGRNIHKAQKLYDAIDNSKLFEGNTAKEDRSLMNVCFHMKDKTGEQKFLDFAAQRSIVGIKGYRDLGGFRASIYNAMPESGIDVLIKAISDFEVAY